MKKIDVHVHLGKLLYSRPQLAARDVLRMMDSLDVQKACIMAVDSPEELDYYFTSDQVLRACKRHPDRLIPFCNIDPRHQEPVAHHKIPAFDPFPYIERFVEQGAKGFGEVLVGLPLDDDRMLRIYDACGRLGLPVLIHMDQYRGLDGVGLPRLEKMLQQFPDTVFIAHAQHWWSEISADVTEADFCDYPARPVVPGGRVEFLLQTYKNIYGDLSANSGRNALLRDPAFTPGFFERNQDKLLYGSDLVSRGQVLRNHDAIDQINVDKRVKEKIYFRNSARLFKVK